MVESGSSGSTLADFIADEPRPSAMPSLPFMTPPGSSVDRPERNGTALPLTLSRRAVLVLGMHRSGTSAVTQALHLLGLDLPGNLIPANPRENPTGFWESADIVAAHQDFLAAAGSNWDDPTPLPVALFQSSEARRCRDRLHRILVRDLADSPLFAIKDPRMCRLVPLWLDLLHEMTITPVVVIPIRHPLDIAASLAARNRFLRAQSVRLWLSHLVLAERHTRGLRRLFVDYSAFVNHPQRGAQRLHQFLNLPGEPADSRLEAISTAIQPRHRHHDAAATPIPSEDLPELAAGLFAAARDAAQGYPLDEAVMDRAAIFLDQAYGLFGEARDPAHLDERLRRQIESLDDVSTQLATQLIESRSVACAAGFVDTVRFHSGGTVEIAGWAIDRRVGTAAETVALLINGQAVATAPVNRERADVTDEAGGHFDRRPGFSIFLRAEKAGEFSSANARVLAFAAGGEMLGALDWSPQADRTLAARFEALLLVERQHHQQQIQALAAVRDQLDQARQATETKVLALQADHQQLAEARRAAGARIVALQAECDQNAATRRDREAALATLQVDYGGLAEAHRAAGAQIAALQAECDQNAATQRDREAALTTLQVEYHSLAEAHRVAEGQIVQLQAERDQARDVGSASETALAALQAEHHDLTAAQAAAGERIAALEVERDQSLAAQRQTGEALATLQAEHHDLTAAQAAAGERIAALEVERDQSLAAQRQTGEALAALQAEHHDLTAAQAAAGERITALEAERDQSIAAQRQTGEVLAALQAEHQTLIAAHTAAGEQILHLQAARDLETAALRHTEESLAALQAEHERLIAAHRTAGEQILQLQAERDQARDASSVSETALVALQAECDQREAAQREVESRLADAGRLTEAQSAALQAARDQSVEVRRDHQAVLATLQAECERLMAARRDSEARLGALRIDLDHLLSDRQRDRRKLATLNADFARLAKQRGAAEDRLTEQEQERSREQESRTRLEEDLARLGSESAALEEALAEERRRVTDGEALLAQERLRLGEEAAQLTQARHDLAATATAREALAVRYDALDQRFATLLVERQALLASFSWKLARLLRGLARLVPLAGWLGRRLGRRRFSAVEARMVIESGLFDPGYYLAANPDVGADPVEHFLAHGGAEGRDPSPLFACAAYAAAHQLPPGRNPLLHHLHATLDRFRASGSFDRAFYLRMAPDVARSRIDPAWHFLTRGWGEGRDCSPHLDLAPIRLSLGLEPNLVLRLDSFLEAVASFGDALHPPETFAADWYLATNPDVRAAGKDPWRHYLRHGWREGRDPNPMFDSKWYLERYPDVRAAGLNPLLHYLRHGAGEGRDPHPLFDTVFYAETVPGTIGRREALAHYLRVGRAEGRPTRPPRAPLSVPSPGKAPRLLFVLHGLGGGTERHCHDLAALLRAEGWEVWGLQSGRGGRVRLSPWGEEGGSHFYHVATPGDWEALIADLRLLAPEHLHFHHFIGFPPALMSLPATLGRAYDITVHDYAWFCPRVTMVGADGDYCRRAEGSGVDCVACLRAVGPHEAIPLDPIQSETVRAWQAERAGLLRGARRLFVPDPDVAERVAALIDLPTPPVVRPHPEPIRRIRPRPPVEGERIRVAVIGGISRDKGGDLLLACAESARQTGLPLSFEVIGSLSDGSRARSLETLTIHGAYRREDLPELLRRIPCHLAVFLSIWPETYCYTLSEALDAGLFPVVTDLGAPARRVRALGWGAVIPSGASPEVINRLLLRSALSQPLPGPDMWFGARYDSMRDGYYQLPQTSSPV